MIVYVTDMGHFLEDGRLPLDIPAPAWRFAAYLGAVIEAATAHAFGEVVSTPLHCRRKPGHRPCPGRLQVRHQDAPAEIAWRCPKCGEEGVISGSAGTPWDLSPSRTPRLDDHLVLLTEAEYRTIGKVKIPDRDALRLVADAWLNEVGVWLLRSATPPTRTAIRRSGTESAT